MLLAIDVGNTNIVLGVFDGKTLAHSWRLPTLRERTADELGLLMHGLFDVSGDRPAGRARRRHGLGRAAADEPRAGDGRALLRREGRWSSSPGSNAGMPILYDPPAEVGADRIVNGIAAYEQYGRDGRVPLIVVRLRHGDDVRRDHREGRVPRRRDLPGRRRSRPTRCSSAPRGCRGSTCASRTTVIGRTTVGAMESGLFYGYVGHGRRAGPAHERRARRARGSAVCVATGGLASVIAPETPLIHHVEPDLTLHGLRIVWERNQ